jgi:hypothetical protein
VTTRSLKARKIRPIGPPEPKTDLELLKNPDQILFVAESQTYTSEAVPALIMTYRGQNAPNHGLYQRIEAVIIDRAKAPKKSLIELTFVFQKEIEGIAGMKIQSPPVESTQLTLEIDTASTDIFFKAFEKAEKFVWAVTSVDYTFSALIERKTQDVEVAQVEMRCLH